MYFFIDRTDNTFDERPCEEARLVVPGGVHPLWIIKIDSLDELVDLSRKYGKLVINTPILRVPTITILNADVI